MLSVGVIKDGSLVFIGVLVGVPGGRRQKKHTRKPASTQACPCSGAPRLRSGGPPCRLRGASGPGPLAGSRPQKRPRLAEAGPSARSAVVGSAISWGIGAVASGARSIAGCPHRRLAVLSFRPHFAGCVLLQVHLSRKHELGGRIHGGDCKSI